MHVNQALPRLSIYSPQKIERQGQLKQQTVHHHLPQ